MLHDFIKEKGLQREFTEYVKSHFFSKYTSGQYEVYKDMRPVALFRVFFPNPHKEKL